MYASGSRSKTFIKPLPMKPLRTALRSARTPRTSSSMAERESPTSHHTTTTTTQSSTTNRSKFTERKQLQMLPLRTRSLRLDQSGAAAAAQSSGRLGVASIATDRGLRSGLVLRSIEAADHASSMPPMPLRRKTIVPTTTLPPSNTAARLWNRKEQAKLKHEAALKQTTTSSSATDKPETPRCYEIGIQTNEAEIMNRDLLIGDIKFLLPSKTLVADMERLRQEAAKKALLHKQRKFEEHAEKQEEHLTDLKEFLEKAVITKRTRKPREALELDRKLINSMDEILNREVPRTESITNIKGRIKKKEKELLNLFDAVENIQIFSK